MLGRSCGLKANGFPLPRINYLALIPTARYMVIMAGKSQIAVPKQSPTNDEGSPPSITYANEMGRLWCCGRHGTESGSRSKSRVYTYEAEQQLDLIVGVTSTLLRLFSHWTPVMIAPWQLAATKALRLSCLNPIASMHLPMELREVANQAQNGRGECEMLHLTEETDTADENQRFRTGRRRPDSSAVGWFPWRLIAENGKCAAEQSRAIPDVVQRPNEISESHLRKENQHIETGLRGILSGEACATVAGSPDDNVIRPMRASSNVY